MNSTNDSLPEEHAMYGIRFMHVKGRSPGYLVKIGRRKIEHTKWFCFKQHGGQEQALSQASAWRDEQVSILPRFTKLEFVTQLRKNNSSGVAGVIRTVRRRKKLSGEIVETHTWMARPPRGMVGKTFYFSVATHGEAKAKALAIEARQQMVMRCEGFHTPNVPPAFTISAS